MNPFKYIKNNQLVKILSLNSISVFVSLLSGFISIKFIAYFLGAEGMAIMGNFKNFSNFIKTFSTLGFDVGVTKLIAEHTSDDRKIKEVITTALVSRVLSSLFISIILILGVSYFNRYVFINYYFENVFYLFAVFLPLFSINTFFIAVLNGYKKFKTLITVNIISSIIGLIISLILIYYKHIIGALIGIAVIESIIALITYYYFRLEKIKFLFSLVYFSKKQLRLLLNFSVMTLTTALIFPNGNLYLRNLIIENEGIQQAGYWEALNTISRYYLLIFSSSLTMYYLPRLSEIKSDLELKKEIQNYFKILVPIFLGVITIVYIFKKQLVLLILNKSFLEVTDLFLWQIMGDTFKILSLAFAYIFVAKMMTIKYIISEIVFYIIYIGASYFLITNFHTKGVVISYTIAYIVYFCMMILLFRTLFTKNIDV